MFLSIMGMYEYDSTLFDGLDVPTYTDKDNNVHVVNKTDVINNILLNCAELEIIYPNFDTMKLAIGVWSASEQDTWRKMYASQMAEYNPLWNVDAEIDHTNRVAGSDFRTITPNTTNEHSVQGFNSSTWSQSDKDTLTGSTNDNSTDDHTETFHERRTGNIGVTASQDLIKKEREIADFSIVEYITQSFKERFCILVY